MATTTKKRSPSSGRITDIQPPACKLSKKDFPELVEPWLDLDDLEPPVWTAEELAAPQVQRTPDGLTIGIYPPNVEKLRKQPSRLEDGFSYRFAAIPPAKKLSSGKCSSCGRLQCRGLLACRGASPTEFVDAYNADADRIRKAIRNSRSDNPDLPTPERRKELRAQWDELVREAAGEERPPMGNGADDDDVVIDLAAERLKKAKERLDNNPILQKEKDKKLHLNVAEAFFEIMKTDGDDLKMVLDKKGVEVMWRYDHETLLWSVVVDEGKFLDRKLQQAVTVIKARHKTNAKLISEARKLVTTDPRMNPVKVTFDAHGKIPVQGMLIDPATLEARPIRREDFCTWNLDIIYDPKAKCVWWERMLADTFSDRSKEDAKANIELLQDFEGAALIDNKNKALRRALIIIGEANSGKSSLLDVMSGVITDDPITTPIADLGNAHGMQSFIRRAPWVLHEAFDQSAWHISSKAKQILSGDFYEVNPKGRPAISMYFTAPAIWATNHPPKFRESTRAMINRMIVMTLGNIFDPENEIGTAAEARKRGYQEPQEFVLAEEKSGILNWALIGAQRAIANGYFEDTKEGKEALHDVRLDSNLVAGFVEECVEFDADVRITVPDFNAAFVSWWKENRGDDYTASPDQIGRSLKALSHTRIAMDRSKFKNNKNIRYYCGIKFNEGGRAHWQNTSDAVSAPAGRSGPPGIAARISITLDGCNNSKGQFVAGAISVIPKEWDDDPQIIRIRAIAAKENGTLV